jgi:uncharacterized protein YfeS
MKFDMISASRYNGGGGHPLAAEFAGLVETNLPDFGDAIEVIGITVHFDALTPQSSLAALYKQHKEFLESLPTVNFLPKKKRLDIIYYSPLFTAEQFGKRKHVVPSAKTLAAFVAEVCDVIQLSPVSLKSNANFDFTAFSQWLTNKTAELPASDSALSTLKARGEQIWQARLAAASPWDLLPIEWDDYHQNARTILDDIFFWDCLDEFAPHGNDSGADLLEMCLEWQQMNPDTDILELFNEVFHTGNGKGVSFVDLEHDAMMLGFAFAAIKLNGQCPREVATEALSTIANERALWKTRTDSPHYEAKLTALKKMESKLASFAK